MSTAKASALIDSIERGGLTLVEVVAALRAIVVELDATQGRLDTGDDDIARRIGHVEDDVSKISDAVNALERAGS
jgi:hypothetical protein